MAPPTSDRFFVECPTCSRPAGSYSPCMSKASRSCRCGAVFKIDVENETAGQVLDA